MSSTPIPSSIQAQNLKSNILPSAIKTSQTVPSMLNMVRNNNLFEKLNKEVISTTSVLSKNLDLQQAEIQNSQSSPIVCHQLNKINNNIYNNPKSIETNNQITETSIKPTIVKNSNQNEVNNSIKQENEIVLIENDLKDSKPLGIDMNSFRNSTQIISNQLPAKIPPNLSYEDLHKFSQTLLTCISQSQTNNNIDCNNDLLSKISVISNQSTLFSESNLNINKNCQQVEKTLVMKTSTPMTQKYPVKSILSSLVFEDIDQNGIDKNFESNGRRSSTSNIQMKVSSKLFQENSLKNKVNGASLGTLNVKNSKTILTSTPLTRLKSKQSDLIVEDTTQNMLKSIQKTNLPKLPEFTTISPLKNNNNNTNNTNNLNSSDDSVDTFVINNQQPVISPPISLRGNNNKINVNLVETNESVFIPNTFQSFSFTHNKNTLMQNEWNNSQVISLNIKKEAIEVNNHLDNTLKNKPNSYQNISNVKLTNNKLPIIIKKTDNEKNEIGMLHDKNKASLKASSIINNKSIFEETTSDIQNENESNEEINSLNVNLKNEKLAQKLVDRKNNLTSNENDCVQLENGNKNLDSSQKMDSNEINSVSNQNNSTLVDSSIVLEITEPIIDKKAQTETRKDSKIESTVSNKSEKLKKKTISKNNKIDLLNESLEDFNEHAKILIQSRKEKENMNNIENEKKISNMNKQNQSIEKKEDSKIKEVKKLKRKIDEKDKIQNQQESDESYILAKRKFVNKDSDEQVSKNKYFGSENQIQSTNKNHLKVENIKNSNYKSNNLDMSNSNQVKKLKETEKGINEMNVQIKKENSDSVRKFKNVVSEKYDLYECDSESEDESKNIKKNVQKENTEIKIKKRHNESNNRNAEKRQRNIEKEKSLSETIKQIPDEKQIDKSKKNKNSKFPKLKRFTIDYQEKEKLQELFCLEEDEKYNIIIKPDLNNYEEKDKNVKSVKDKKTPSMNKSDLYQVESNDSESDQEVIITSKKEKHKSIINKNVIHNKNDDEIEIKKNIKVEESKDEKNSVINKHEIVVIKSDPVNSDYNKSKKKLNETEFNKNKIDDNDAITNKKNLKTTESKHETKLVETSSCKINQDKEKVIPTNFKSYKEKDIELLKSKPKKTNQEIMLIKNDKIEPKLYENSIKLRSKSDSTDLNYTKDTKIKEKKNELKSESSTSKTKNIKRKSVQEKNDLDAGLLIEEPLLKIPKLLKEELEKIEKHNQKILANKKTNRVYIIDSNSESEDEKILNKKNDTIKNKKSEEKDKDKDKDTETNKINNKNKNSKKKTEQDNEEINVKSLTTVNENNKQKTIESYFSTKNNTNKKTKRDIVEEKTSKSNKKSDIIVSSEDELNQKEEKNKKSKVKKKDDDSENCDAVKTKKEDESKSEVKVEDDKFKVPLLPQPSHKKLIILKTNRSISNENKTDVSINNFFSPEICKKHFLNASALKQDLSLSASKLLTSFDSTKTSINNTTANTTLKKRIVLKMNTSSNSPSNNVTPKRVDYLSEMLKSANKNKNQSKF